MPKQIYQLRDFSGGLNNLKDAADIADNEVAEAKNMSFTQQGAVGGAFNMKHASNNSLADLLSSDLKYRKRIFFAILFTIIFSFNIFAVPLPITPKIFGALTPTSTQKLTFL